MSKIVEYQLATRVFSMMRPRVLKYAILGLFIEKSFYLSIHLQEEGKEIHNEACFKQTCNQDNSSCGRARFQEIFGALTSKLGDRSTEVFQHQKQTYLKPDGTQVHGISKLRFCVGC